MIRIKSSPFIYSLLLIFIGILSTTPLLAQKSAPKEARPAPPNPSGKAAAGDPNASTLGEAIDVQTLNAQKEAFRTLYGKLTLEEIIELVKLFEITYPEGATKEDLITILMDRLKITIVEAAEEEKQKTITLQQSRRQQSKRDIEKDASAMSINYDKVIMITQTDAKGYYKIIAFGHCHVLWGTREIFADLVVVNYKDKPDSNIGDKAEEYRAGELGNSNANPGDPETKSMDHTKSSASPDDPKNGAPPTPPNASENPNSPKEGVTIETGDQNPPSAADGSTPPPVEGSGEEGTEETPAAQDFGEVTEIMGKGHLKFKDSSQIILADKAFFYFKTQRIVAYNAVTYYKPFYVRSEKAKRISSTQFIVLNAQMSSCELDYPHYMIKTGQAWFYHKDKAIITNTQYIIGNSVIVYFPFIFRTDFGTGIQTAFGFERGAGWYLHNTIKGKLGEEPYTLKLDYYQKIGLYMGFDSKIKLVNLNLATAYDRAVKYVGDRDNRFSNYFDTNGDGSYETNSALRYKISMGMSLPLSGDPEKELQTLYKDLGIAYETDATGKVLEDEPSKYITYNDQGQPIFQEGLTDLQKEQELSKEFKRKLREKSKGIFGSIKPSMSLNFTQNSDPFFQQQFESAHREKFDLYELIDFSKKSNQSLVGNQGNISPTSIGRQISFNTGVSIGTLSVGFSGNWNWNIIRDIENPDAVNPYNPLQYYKFIKNSFNFPNINARTSGTLIPNVFDYFAKEEVAEGSAAPASGNPDLTRGQQQQRQAPPTPSTGSSTPVDVTQPAQGSPKDSTAALEEYVDPEEEALLKKYTFRRSLGLSYGFGFDFQGTKGFDEYEVLKNEQYGTSVSGNYSVPFSIGYGFLDANASHNLSLNVSDQIHKNPTELQAYSDETSSKGRWSSSNSVGLQGSFLDEYEFLATKINVSYSQSFGGLLGRPSVYSTSSPGGTLTINDELTRSQSYSASLSFFRSTLSISSGDTLHIPESIKAGYLGQIDTQGTYTKKNSIITMDDIERSYKQPISMSLTNNIFENLNFSQSYSEDRKYKGNGIFKGRSKSYSIGSSLNIPITHEFTDWFIVDSMSLSANYNHDYINFQGNSAGISVSASFQVTKDWKFSFSTSTSNNHTYLYTESWAKQFNQEQVNFFTDILQSIKFWDPETRAKSIWKTRGFNMSINHSLHHWDLSFSFSYNQTAYQYLKFFEPRLTVSVTLKDMSGFSAPPIESEKFKRY